MPLPVFPVCLGLKDFCKWWLSISWSSQICSASFQFSSSPHRCFCWKYAHHVYLGIQICWILARFQFSSQALSSIDYIPLLLITFPTFHSSVPQRNLPPYGLYFSPWLLGVRSWAEKCLHCHDGAWAVGWHVTHPVPAGIHLLPLTE